MFSKLYMIRKKPQPIILCISFEKKNFTPTYLSQNWQFIPKIVFLKVSYTEAMLFSIALHQINIYILSKSESVKFLLIESMICLFTNSPVKKYTSLLNQLIITN